MGASVRLETLPASICQEILQIISQAGHGHDRGHKRKGTSVSFCYVGRIRAIFQLEAKLIALLGDKTAKIFPNPISYPGNPELS